MSMNTNNDLQGLPGFQSYQVVIWLDAEQISEVAEGQRGVRLEAEVRIVMCWSQVASLTGNI